MANYSFQEGKLEIALCNGSKGIMDREGLEHDKILPFLSVVQCYQGYYEIGLDGGPPVPLEEGGLFITRPDQPQQIIHHCRADGSPMRAQWVFFSVISDGFLDITRCLIPKPVLSAQEAAPFKEVLSEIAEISPVWNEKAPKSFAAKSDLLEESRRLSLGFRLLELLLQKSQMSFPEEGYLSIQPAITIMDQLENGANRIRLEDLARACSLSVTSFTSLFRRLTGDSPMSFYMKRRLTRAATALLTEKKSLGEIAQDNGFYDQFHLSREFKRRYGVSPRQYRQDFRRQNSRLFPDSFGKL